MPSPQLPPIVSEQRVQRLGNPGPLGLISFASTTFVLSMYSVRAHQVLVPNVFVGMAIAVGGLVQLLAGQWDFARGNTFGGTVFSSYGGFWLSMAVIYIPGSGILGAFEANGTGAQLSSALGTYLITWFIGTFIFLIAALRTNVASIALFGSLSMTFILLAAAHFTNSNNTSKAGGVFGIITALIAYYGGAAQLFTKQDSYLTLPVGNLWHGHDT